MRRVDVVALVFGLLLTATAAVALWAAFDGRINWSLLGVAAPVCLTAVGILGLALSRQRT